MNKKRKEVEPIIPRTCFHGPLVTLRPPTAPRPLTVTASAFHASRQPPLSQNPAYAPATSCIHNQGDSTVIPALLNRLYCGQEVVLRVV